jgi:hypothetical protein
MQLGDEEIDRYSRQILLPEIGARGQQRLLASSAAIVGNGGSLAHLCALYLAGAGVGRLGLVFADPSSAGALEELAEEVADLNPTVRIEILPLPSIPAPRAALASFDLWIDTGGVAFARPDLVPWVRAAGHSHLAAGVNGARGWLARRGAADEEDGCIACALLHERDDARERRKGDSAPSATGVVASLLACEALAVLLGWNDEHGSRLHYDGTASTLEVQPVAPHPRCPVCAGRARARS